MHDVGGDALVVEGGATPLVEALPVAHTAEGPVAETGPLGLLLGLRSLAVRIGQGLPP
jgi:hypothetical protein